ncbi:rCG35295 [Rattus norvegicus]|uniref:RCG35295 n=1 Tax=Rattus norvegicus TaxID=10116 RepID=A6HL07_RAT|nr:rCG35295 [Rattus norvegicus]
MPVVTCLVSMVMGIEPRALPMPGKPECHVCFPCLDLLFFTDGINNTHHHTTQNHQPKGVTAHWSGPSHVNH